MRWIYLEKQENWNRLSLVFHIHTSKAAPDPVVLNTANRLRQLNDWLKRLLLNGCFSSKLWLIAWRVLLYRLKRLNYWLKRLLLNGFFFGTLWLIAWRVLLLHLRWVKTTQSGKQTAHGIVINLTTILVSFFSSFFSLSLSCWCCPCSSSALRNGPIFYSLI